MIEIVERFIAENYGKLGLSKAPSKINLVKMGGRLDRFGSVPFACFLNGRSSPTFYVKFPRDPTNSKRVKAEFHNLREIRGRVKSNIIKNSIPAPLRYNKSPVFTVQSAVVGNPMLSEVTKGNFWELSDNVLAWLAQFHLETEMAKVDYQKYICGEIGRIKREIGGYSKSAAGIFDRALTPRVKDWKTNIKLPLTYIHGDFNPHNILISNKGFGIFDWEESSSGIPFIDIFHYFTVSSFSVEFRRNDRDLCRGDRYRRYFLGNMEKILSLIRNRHSSIHLDNNLFIQMYIFYLAHMAANEVRRDRLINNFDLWMHLSKNFVSEMGK